MTQKVQKLIILGAGESGVGAAILGKEKGYDVFVSDASEIKASFQKELQAAKIEFESGQHSMPRILTADLIIKSPGIPEKTALMKAIREAGIKVISEIAEIDDADDKQMFLDEYSLEESGLSRLIRSSYELLNLITYFTAGVQEVRAWTIQKGWKAPQAASVIHTDFEKGFIKAEVIAFVDFIKYGSEAACRDNGRLRIEGKEYLVQDGDVMHFRFNV